MNSGEQEKRVEGWDKEGGGSEREGVQVGSEGRKWGGRRKGKLLIITFCHDRGKV